jgi:hypothetical protein
MILMKFKTETNYYVALTLPFLVYIIKKAFKYVKTFFRMVVTNSVMKAFKLSKLIVPFCYQKF